MPGEDAKSLAAADAAEPCPLPASAHEPESAAACEHGRSAHAEVAADASAAPPEAASVQPVSPTAAAQHEPGAAGDNGHGGDTAGPRGKLEEGEAAAAALEAASARPVQDPSASARPEPVAADINGQASGVKPSPRGSHKRRRAAGSMQLTPEQQKVAVAFLVVMKRALMNGGDAAALVGANLAFNNSAMRSLVDRLFKGTPMVSLASFGRNAPSKILDSLTLLAEQCTAAGRWRCSPGARSATHIGSAYPTRAACMSGCDSLTMWQTTSEQRRTSA